MRQIPFWSYSISLAAEPASASTAREFVCAHLRRHDLPRFQDDLSLVVSELVTNAITHAQTPITVVLQEEGHAVRLTVEDRSPVVPVMAAGEELDGGGRGLVIVDILSRDWGVTSRPDGSKSVWAVLAADGDLAALT